MKKMGMILLASLLIAGALLSCGKGVNFGEKKYTLSGAGQ